jgi:acetyl esterase/lipase
MKKILKWVLFLAAVGLCLLIFIGARWVIEYQALSDGNADVVLSPDFANVFYCTMEGVPLTLDLYYPENAAAPTPVLVYVHGGSFTGGDKRKGSGVIDIPAMTPRGYAVAAVNYRLMPQHPFPAEIMDAKCAVRFLRAHASEYELKTEKIGIWGGSAGTWRLSSG